MYLKKLSELCSFQTIINSPEINFQKIILLQYNISDKQTLLNNERRKGGVEMFAKINDYIKKLWWAWGLPILIGFFGWAFITYNKDISKNNILLISLGMACISYFAGFIVVSAGKFYFSHPRCHIHNEISMICPVCQKEFQEIIERNKKNK